METSKEIPQSVVPPKTPVHRKAVPKVPPLPVGLPPEKPATKKPSPRPPVNEDQILKWLKGPEYED